MTRLVLFDIDGTLIASGGAGLHAFAAVARSTFGQPNGVAGIQFAGRTDLSIVREFFNRSRIETTPANFERFLDDYIFWLDHFLGQRPGRILPGVRELIAGFRRLPDPPTLGLLTGNIRLGAEVKLRHYGLWEDFVLGAFGDENEDRNRLAGIARKRGEEWLERPLADEEVLVIGDTHHDIHCAKAINARCLAVATGGIPHETLSTHGATWTVPTLAQLDAAHLCS
jgi:phosphoglycolate phosphatase-like HAD superfamily hydrolase